jgi:hypothetical protein
MVLDNLLFLLINFITRLQYFAAIMNMEMTIEGYSIILTTIRARAKYLISTKLKNTSSDLNIPFISLELLYFEKKTFFWKDNDACTLYSKVYWYVVQ